MMMNDADLSVAVYQRHSDAEAAVKALQRAGFDMTKISIVGRDYQIEEHVVGYLNAGDRARIFGKYGAMWGGLMGILFGAAVMFVPVVGNIIVLGPLAAALVGGIEGAVAVGGASALVGALSALGIPKNSVLRYETALKADHFMLVVHGDAHDMARARELLATSGYASLEHHADMAAHRTRAIPVTGPD